MTDDRYPPPSPRGGQRPQPSEDARRGRAELPPEGHNRHPVRRQPGQRSPRAAQPRAEAAHVAGRRRVFLRRRIMVGAAALTVLGTVAVGLVVQHLNGNIRTVAVPKSLVGVQTPDSQGRVPVNVLVIGSDTRGSSADCKIGGGCKVGDSKVSGKEATSLGANADVEMLVHISADRSNASITSIPRDTVVDIPECTDPVTGEQVPGHRARINSSLKFGPTCTMQTVHDLTGAPLDHFAVIDFAGVVTMSDAIGGVQVCVSDDVYDTYSHLKLSKGSHTLQGESALQFMRTRHGFGDGGDIGRTVAQHLFLSSMLRQLESASTLANPVRLYSLANAATKAVTVDTGLGDIGKLTGLASELNKVPGKRITFSTAPTVPNPENRNEVVLASNASTLFAKIKADVSLSSPAPVSASPSSSSPTPPIEPSTATTPSPAGSATDYGTSVDKAVGCASVAKVRTVQVNGIPMTPTQAYAASPKVPDSAS